MYTKEEIATFLNTNLLNLSNFLCAASDKIVLHTTMGDLAVERIEEEWIVCGNHAGAIPNFASDKEIDDFVIILTTRTQEIFPFLWVAAENIKVLEKFADKEIPSILAVLSGEEAYSIRLESSKNRKLAIDFVETGIDIIDFRARMNQDRALLRSIAFLVSKRRFGFQSDVLEMLPDTEKFILLLEGKLSPKRMFNDIFENGKPLKDYTADELAINTVEIGKYRNHAG